MKSTRIESSAGLVTALLWFGIGLCSPMLAAESSATPAPIPDPYPDPYGKTQPDFVTHISPKGLYRSWVRSSKEMKLSTEKSFHTFNQLNENDRVYALIEAGKKKEAEGAYREAIKVYQILFDRILSKDPNILYRISKHGIFVPAAQYVQRRIMRFPKEDLSFYRTLHDARAREAYELARAKFSLPGLTDIADKMLATSYGDNALMELGNAALDSGQPLEALERYQTLLDFFPDSDCRTRELTLKIEYCRKVLGDKPGKPVGTVKSSLSPKSLAGLKALVAGTTFKPTPRAQLASSPHITADDYAQLPPTQDPKGLQEPVWKQRLPGSRNDYYVYTHPVITENSVIYRHKNIVYCRSLLGGGLRWKNDLGGRVTWQNWQSRQYAQEGVLVQDGLVFTPMYKNGPSLVALDEITGQLKWAYGPMSASSTEEARMRFESAPTGGQRSVYASYIKDNIDGDTHTDSEYGVMAFDSASGRVLWRQEICRMMPEKFTGGFAVKHRNRIRSFSSPPLCVAGTVYVSTNAGAVSALDARSGRIKWTMRYPYHPGVHDLTRTFGKLGKLHGGNAYVRPHSPMFWLSQPPLLIGEQLFVLPVDTPLMLALDRRTGKVLWSRKKMGPGFTHFLGPISTGELVISTTGRVKHHAPFNAWRTGSPIILLDPKTGKTTWQSPDIIMPDKQPVMSHYIPFSPAEVGVNHRWFENAARPFLTSDDKLFVMSWTDMSKWYRPHTQVFNLAGVDLKTHKVIHQRRYYTDATRSLAKDMITSSCLKEMKSLEALPARNKRDEHRLQVMKDIVADTVPVNKYGPFMPYARMTFKRQGVLFELRIGPRELSMLYERAEVDKALAGKKGPEADFARAELAFTDGRLAETEALLTKCTKTISSEDLDFRAQVKQQLYRVHQELVRDAVYAAQPKEELRHCLGMSRTAGTMSEEIQTLFAAAAAQERNGNDQAAAKLLRQIVARYGRYEYPVSSIAALGREKLLKDAGVVLNHGQSFFKSHLYGEEARAALGLLRGGLPLYLSPVSPAEKDLTLRAGEMATTELLRLIRRTPKLAETFDKMADQALVGRSDEEQCHRLGEFPGTKVAKGILLQLLEEASRGKTAAARRRQWALADVARLLRLRLPEAHAARLSAPAPAAPYVPMVVPAKERAYEFSGEEGAAKLVLERRDGHRVHPELLLVGARVKKRLDNKFELACMDVATEKVRWTKKNIRLKGTGQEPGFFEAFVLEDRVIVHGLHDVFAFRLTDGVEIWHSRMPFNFEIKQTVLSGDLLMLCGKAETLALYLNTDHKDGEVAWQVGERGSLYARPWFHGDRFVSVRQEPFSVTVRYRATGNLIGRLDLPDLTRQDAHPLLENGPKAFPLAHAGRRLVVSDGMYYIVVDTENLGILWKRLIDGERASMRFFLGEDSLAVVKKNYDRQEILMLSLQSGDVLWRTDPKKAKSPQPMHSALIEGGKIYGIGVHPGMGFYFVGRDVKTGKLLFQTSVTGYASKPMVKMIPARQGGHVAVKIRDRQDFEMKGLDLKTGKVSHTIKLKGVGSFGVHGRVSATVQNGRLVLLSKDKLKF